LLSVGICYEVNDAPLSAALGDRDSIATMPRDAEFVTALPEVEHFRHDLIDAQIGIVEESMEGVFLILNAQVPHPIPCIFGVLQKKLVNAISE
jgi:hypothetical protein